MLSPAQQYLVKKINNLVKDTRYGNMTVTFIIQKGEPVLKSINIVVMKRKRYKMPTA